MSRALFAIAASALLLTSCAPEGKLRRRAAFDLQCPEQDLKVVELGGQTRGVEGCGNRGTYIWVCTQAGPCEWVMDSAGTQAPSK